MCNLECIKICLNLLIFPPRPVLRRYLRQMRFENLGQAWENLLTRRPQWGLKFDRGAGSGADRWIVCVN